MTENPIFLAVGTIMVALLVAAWLFPDQRWLDPFRPRQLSRPAARKRPESSESFGAFQYGRSAAPAPTHIETRLAERQRSFQRFSRIHAGVMIMLAGVAILFGHYVMSAMTASNPDAQPGRAIAVTFAVLLFAIGAAVILVRGRDR